MPKLLRRILKYPALLFARLGIVGPLVFFYARIVEEVDPGHSRGDGNLPTLFALTSNRFRGDLEILARTGEFRVLQVPFAWQARLVNLFYPLDTPREAMLQPEADEKIARMQRRYRRFLRAFLPALYKKLGVDCVIGAAIGYVQDLDWGAVSEEVGVPYVVLHRECFVTNSAHFRRFVEFSGKMGKFSGSHIIVHNEVARDAFIRSGYVSPDHISSLGCLRMDRFVQRVRENRPGARSRKKVVFFSFAPGVGLLGRTGLWPKDRSFGFFALFENTHVAFAELARDNPEIDFIVKPKWGDHWVDEIDRVLRNKGIERRGIPNLQITAEADPQGLILDSDVVVGFGSTTLLEAAIAAKPVIVPYFDEALRPEYVDYIHLRDNLHVFDVAESPEALKALIVQRLEDPTVMAECIAARELLFERYVSSLRGDAVRRYIEAIKAVIAERRETLRTQPMPRSTAWGRLGVQTDRGDAEVGAP
ncbi:MAG: hypothetical protein IH851_13385 [Armatimonadetes bacterium]|nr:hypothetical protein [Armatimonadota bacterium]